MAEGKEDFSIPAYCALAHKNLDMIQQTLTETNTEVKNLSAQLISAEGYIPRIHERLSLVESSAERAHERLDSEHVEIQSVKNSHNALAVKVAGMVALIVVALDFVIGKFL